MQLTRTVVGKGTGHRGQKWGRSVLTERLYIDIKQDVKKKKIEIAFLLYFFSIRTVSTVTSS